MAEESSKKEPAAKSSEETETTAATILNGQKSHDTPAPKEDEQCEESGSNMEVENPTEEEDDISMASSVQGDCSLYIHYGSSCSTVNVYYRAQYYIHYGSSCGTVTAVLLRMYVIGLNTIFALQLLVQISNVHNLVQWLNIFLKF